MKAHRLLASFYRLGACAQSRDSMALSSINYSRRYRMTHLEQVYKLRAIAGK